MRDSFGGLNWDRSFNAAAEVEALSRCARVRRRPRFRRSPVDRYRGELGQLYAAGASFAQLVDWLRRRKRVKVSRSWLHARMATWPEVEIRSKQHG